MEKIIQHTFKYTCLGSQKPKSAEKGNRWLLGQYYTIHTVIDKLFDFSLS